MRLILALFAVVALAGCAAKTDMTQLGAGVGAKWNNGPHVGVDASLGKHEAALFPAAGSAAEGVSGPASVEAAPR